MFSRVRLNRVKALEHRRLSRGSLRSYFSGTLVTKKGLRTKEIEEHFRTRLLNHAAAFQWRCLPRARVAVSLRFFDSEKNHPDIHTLVKLYLDALKGIAFADDRQVHYLEASTWRLPADRPSSVVTAVWRLVDYRRYVELAYNMDRNDDDEDTYPPYAYPRDNTVQQAMMAKQYEALSSTRIFPDSQVALKLGIQSVMDRYRMVHPLIFDLGGLPSVQEGTSTFKGRVANILDKYAAKKRLFSRVFIPVELNAQITRQGIRLVKDLDNMMSLVCPLIREKLLDKQSYINGYRAFVIQDEKTPPRVDIQLLPPGAIERFAKRLELGLKAHGEDLGAYL